jgi:hypothetical protein
MLANEQASSQPKIAILIRHAESLLSFWASNPGILQAHHQIINQVHHEPNSLPPDLASGET